MLAYVNKAAGIRLLWRACHSDPLWAQYMRFIYIKDQSISLLWLMFTIPVLGNLQLHKEITIPLVQQSHEISILTWKPATHFSFGLAQNAVRSSSTIPPITALFGFSTAAPKMPVCLLRALNNKLLIFDNLNTRQILVESSICTLYGSLPKIMAHLFFSCLYSGYVWELCRLKLGMNPGPVGSISKEALLIASTFKHRVKITRVARMAIYIAVQHIWHERNIRIFQNARKSKTQIAQDVIEDIKIT